MVKVQKASEHLHSGGGERFDAGECLRQAFTSGVALLKYNKKSYADDISFYFAFDGSNGIIERPLECYACLDAA